MPEPTPEAWAQIRFAYEHTDQPLAHICAEHEISIPMLRYRMKRWEWRRRKPLIPREGPPPVAPSADTFLHPPLEGEGRRFERQREPAGWGEAVSLEDRPTPLRLADASRSDAPHRCAGGGMEQVAPYHAISPPPGEGEEAASIVPRLQSAVARVLPAIEATIARLAAGPSHPRDMEQAGRTLSSLTRSLRELNALLSQHQARADADRDNDLPEDMDAFRENLARRINLFMESRKDEDFGAKPPET